MRRRHLLFALPVLAGLPILLRPRSRGVAPLVIDPDMKDWAYDADGWVVRAGE